MKDVPKIPRGPSAPDCVIKQEPYYNVAAAARIIKVVSQSTLRRWTVNGWSSFGLPLDVVQRKGQLLLPELSIQVLKGFLGKHPLPQPRASAEIRKDFRQAVREAMFDYMTPRSAYSRARSPRPFPR